MPQNFSLDNNIKVLPGTDIADAWDRFEVFEALHHTMQICNPMSSAQVDELIDALDLQPEQSVLDVACGYGEVLFRCAEQSAIAGTGIDLSPWMITSAQAQSADRDPSQALSWVLGEARDYRPVQPADVAICIGAEWVWHDFNGTARALSERVADGGVVVIGAARLHLDADPDQVRRERGRVETIADMAAMLEQHGLEPFHRIDPDDAGWDAYLDRTAIAAQQWAAQHPGSRAQQWLAEQAEWRLARERDRDVIGWSLWMARRHD